MKIYLIRHGDAESSSLSQKDFDRNLSAQGIEKLKKTVYGWKNYIKSFDFLVSSPYLRAIQTTQIIADIYNINNKIIIDERIGCGSRTEDIINIANSLAVEKIAFIGHEPDMSNHISSLISAGGVNVEFKKAMIAKIAFGGRVRFSKGVLQYLIPSELFTK
jgi:Phosphohistidine phosphatase SixA